VHRTWLVALAFAALFSIDGRARAQDAEEEPEPAEPGPRLPLPYAERPLTLPRLVLEPVVAFDIDHQVATAATLGAGVVCGASDDCQLSAIVAPVQLSPKVSYGEIPQPGPALGVTYRLESARTQVGLHLDATLITLPNSSGVVIRPGIPIRSRSGDLVRIDYGIFFRATAARTTEVGMEIPFSVSVDVAPPFHLGLATGLTLPTFDDPLGSAFPVGVFGGYALRGQDGPVLEIDPFARWPRLIAGSPPPQGTQSIYQVGLDVRVYLYL
jgi:hypothetical protein